jgi:hypothetical protein
MLAGRNPNKHPARLGKAQARPFAPKSHSCETSLPQATQPQLLRHKDQKTKGVR